MFYKKVLTLFAFWCLFSSPGLILLLDAGIAAAWASLLVWIALGLVFAVVMVLMDGRRNG